MDTLLTIIGIVAFAATFIALLYYLSQSKRNPGNDHTSSSIPSDDGHIS